MGLAQARPNYSVELRAQNRNLRRVVGVHYEVAAVAGFHYEIYGPAATQPDWSTSLSCVSYCPHTRPINDLLVHRSSL